MQRLDPAKAQLLTQLISPHYPFQRIMLITDGRTDLHETLHDFTRRKGFEFDLRTVGCDIAPEDPHPECRIEAMNLQSPRYNRHAKQYENIFLALDPALWEEEAAAVLSRCHAVIKNAGILTILIERGEPLLRRLDGLLEGCDYVAIGHVEIFEDFDVVTAKKLHGWGSR